MGDVIYDVFTQISYCFFSQNVVPANERCIDSKDYFIHIAYLRASLPQITVLRERSTYCNQDLTFECSGITEVALSALGVWYDYDDNDVQFSETNIGEFAVTYCFHLQTACPSVCLS